MEIAKLRAASQKALMRGQDKTVYRLFGEMEASHIDSAITLARWRGEFARRLERPDEAREHLQRMNELQKIKRGLLSPKPTS